MVLNNLILKQLPSSVVNGVPVLVAPVMFTQGINEKQNMAVVFGATSSLQLQQSINRKHLQRMQRYFAKYRALLFYSMHIQYDRRRGIISPRQDDYGNDE